jgi:hypothetical protein
VLKANDGIKIEALIQIKAGLPRAGPRILRAMPAARLRRLQQIAARLVAYHVQKTDSFLDTVKHSVCHFKFTVAN